MELVNLKVKDVDLVKSWIYVIGGKTGDRDVPITPQLEPYLIVWSNIRPKHSRFFFTTLKGKRLNDRYLRDFIKRYGKRIGLNFIHPHTLRHTFATQTLKRNDINTPDLQYLLGHKALSSTQVYTHVEPKDLHKKLREDKKEKKDEDLKNLVDQLIEQQKLTMKVLEAITERINK